MAGFKLNIMFIIEVEDTPSALTAGSVGIGQLFRTVDYEGNDVYLRVEPTGYLNNSRVIKENLLRGKVLVVQLCTGELKFIQPSQEVVIFEHAKMQLRRE